MLLYKEEALLEKLERFYINEIRAAPRVALKFLHIYYTTLFDSYTSHCAIVAVNVNHEESVICRNEEHVAVCAEASPVWIYTCFPIPICIAITMMSINMLSGSRVIYIEEDNVSCVVVEVATCYDCSILVTVPLCSCNTVVVLHP